jgi:hypothetical protein
VILAIPKSAGVPAITQKGEEREGAAICELKNVNPFGPAGRTPRVNRGTVFWTRLARDELGLLPMV